MHQVATPEGPRFTSNIIIGTIKSMNAETGRGTLTTSTKLISEDEPVQEHIPFVLDSPSIFQHLSEGKKVMIQGDYTPIGNQVAIRVKSASLMA